MDHEWKKDTGLLNSSGNYGGQRLKFDKVVCVNRKTEFKGLVVKAVSSSSGLPPPPPGQSGKNDWKVFRKSRKSKGVCLKDFAEVMALIFVPVRTIMVMIIYNLHLLYVCDELSLVMFWLYLS